MFRPCHFQALAFLNTSPDRFASWCFWSVVNKWNVDIDIYWLNFFLNHCMVMFAIVSVMSWTCKPDFYLWFLADMTFLRLYWALKFKNQEPSSLKSHFLCTPARRNIFKSALFASIMSILRLTKLKHDIINFVARRGNDELNPGNEPFMKYRSIAGQFCISM